VIADATADSLPVGMVEGAISITTETEQITRLVSVTTSGAVIRTSAVTVDFGQTPLATDPAPRPFTIYNEGNASIDVQLTPPASPFGISDTTPFRIDAGLSRQVDVSFEPMFVQTYEGSVGLSFAGAVCQPPPLSIALGGEVSDAPILVDYNQIDFGSTNCHAGDDTRALTLTSNLMNPQTLTFTLSGPHAEDFASIPDQILDPASQLSVQITRKSIRIPETPGPRSAQLEITAMPSGEVKQVDLFYSIDAPFLATSPDSMDFVVPRGQFASMPIAVSNFGNAPASVTTAPQIVSLPGGGRVQPTPNPAFVGPESDEQLTMQVFAGSQAIGVYDIFFTVDSPGQCNYPHAIVVSVVIQ
jgi:hypothetical protein